MLNEWSDKLSSADAADMWRVRMESEVARRVTLLETDLRALLDRQAGVLPGFFKAMRGFLALRESLFPEFPADPAWKILMTLAETPNGSDKASVTAIAAGAEVPLTTALRYIAAMEAAGIVERTGHVTDKRRIMVQLTDEGRRRLDRISERWTARYGMLGMIAIAAVIVWRSMGLA